MINTPYLEGIQTHWGKVKSVIRPPIYLQATTAGFGRRLIKVWKVPNNTRQLPLVKEVINCVWLPKNYDLDVYTKFGLYTMAISSISFEISLKIYLYKKIVLAVG